MSLKVLILGLGLNQGGVGSARFFAKQGAIVRVTDLRNKEQLKPSIDQLKDFPGMEYILGGHRQEDIDWADLIIRNPAVKPDNKFLLYALNRGKRIEMDLGIFLQFVRKKQLIGVTGTKGKSTTSSLIHAVLKKANKKVVQAGNIGTSVLEVIPQITPATLIVLELSSFQLEALEQHQLSPHMAVVTNIYHDHLNYYSSMNQYIAAKKIIARYQDSKDFLFLYKNDQILNSRQFKSGLKAKITYFQEDNLPKNFPSKLLGAHNKINMAAALAVARSCGINLGQSLGAIKNFGGVEFRLQLIKSNSLKIYNDSAATIPDAATAALYTLPGAILITGGMDKNLVYQDFAQTIDRLAKSVYFLEGSATEQIKQSLINQSKIKGVYNNFADLLRDVKKETKKGGVILFSPGATSFNLFQNEFDRGRKFNEAVEEVFK